MHKDYLPPGQPIATTLVEEEQVQTPAAPDGKAWNRIVSGEPAPPLAPIEHGRGISWDDPSQ